MSDFYLPEIKRVLFVFVHYKNKHAEICNLFKKRTPNIQYLVCFILHFNSYINAACSQKLLAKSLPVVHSKTIRCLRVENYYIRNIQNNIFHNALGGFLCFCQHCSSDWIVGGLLNSNFEHKFEAHWFQQAYPPVQSRF